MKIILCWLGFHKWRIEKIIEWRSRHRVKCDHCGAIPIHAGPYINGHICERCNKMKENIEDITKELGGNYTILRQQAK